MEVVLSGRLGRHLIGGYSKNDLEEAERALQDVELLGLRDRPIGRLSGGELQRVLIARALASGPEILILDEPAANIDIQAELGLYQLLDKLNGAKTIIMVTHDLGVVSSHVKTLACLNRRLVCHGFETVTPEMIQQTYDHTIDLVTHGEHRRVVLGKETGKND